MKFTKNYKLKKLIFECVFFFAILLLLIYKEQYLKLSYEILKIEKKHINKKVNNNNN